MKVRLPGRAAVSTLLPLKARAPMRSTPSGMTISVSPDPEKQFLYKLMLEEPDPAAALANYRVILERINSKENYDYYLNCGFNVILRDDARTEEETVRLAEKLFKIGD